MLRLAALSAVAVQASAFELIPYDDFNLAFNMLQYCEMTANAYDVTTEFSDSFDPATAGTGTTEDADAAFTYAAAGTEATCTAAGGTWTTRSGWSEAEWNSQDIDDTSSGIYVAQIAPQAVVTQQGVDYWAWQYGLDVSSVVPQEIGMPSYLTFHAAADDAQAFLDGTSLTTAVMPLSTNLKKSAGAVVAEESGDASALNINIRLTPGTLADEEELAALEARWQGAVGGTESGIYVKARGANTITMNSIPATSLNAINNVLEGEPEAEIVDVLPPIRTGNYDARWITTSGLVEDQGSSSFLDHGLTGEGQVVAVADTGVDYQSSFFLDSTEAVTFSTDQFGLETFVSETHRTIAQYVAYANQVEDGDDGHGTHVAGSVMGNTGNTGLDTDPNSGGGLVTGQPFTDFNGIAFDARLAFFDIGLASGGLDVPASLDLTLFPYAGDVDAFIHSDSWGANANQYDAFAIGVDQYTWDNQAFLVLFAAGNSGPNPGTLGTPATAKNCLSVGASVNYYESTTTPFDPATELRLADFSSRGPASDGRIKPDVSAPGFYIVSAASRMTGATGHTTLLQNAGTSMATPVTAGTAALIREYFMRGFYPTGEEVAAHAFTPMGSALKAMLINGGVELFSQSGTDLPQSGNTLPNMDTGFGRVTTDNTVYFKDTSEHSLYVDGAYSDDCTDCPQVENGAVVSYDFEVVAGTELRATLVWSDAPGTNGATKALVNDLDLACSSSAITTAPNGGTTRDSINNVEQIVIPATDVMSTTYTFTVTGQSVVQGPQPYSLVVVGAFQRTATLFPEIAPTVDPEQVAVSNGRILVNGANFSPTTSENTVSFSCTTLTQTAPSGVVTSASATSLVVELTSEGTCTSDVHMTVTTGDFTTDPLALEASSSTGSGLADVAASSDVCTSASDSVCNSFPDCDECSGDDEGVDAALVVVPILLVVGLVGATVFFKKNPESWESVKGMVGAGSAKGSAVPTSQFASAGQVPQQGGAAVEMRQGQPSFPPPRPASQQLPEGWERAMTPEGEVYYFNVYTGASTWDRPMVQSGSRRMGAPSMEGGGDPTTWT